MEKLETGSPPVAQLRRSFVAIACGTDWERLEHTGGEPAPIRMFTVCTGPTSLLPPDPLPGEKPWYVKESAPDAPGFGV
jgi:hypothetical protein